VATCDEEVQRHRAGVKAGLEAAVIFVKIDAEPLLRELAPR
jgi:hypothetical protein